MLRSSVSSQGLSYILEAFATDNGLPIAKQTTATVNITILPTRNPQLKPYYYRKLDENNLIGAFIMLVTATDEDEAGPAATIGQFILSGPDSTSFTIDNLGNNSAILRAG